MPLAKNPDDLTGKMPGSGESVAFALCPGEWLAELQGTDFLASSSPSQSTTKRYRGTSTLKKWGDLAYKVDLGQCDKGVFQLWDRVVPAQSASQGSPGLR